MPKFWSSIAPNSADLHNEPIFSVKVFIVKIKIYKTAKRLYLQKCHRALPSGSFLYSASDRRVGGFIVRKVDWYPQDSLCPLLSGRVFNLILGIFNSKNLSQVKLILKLKPWD